MIFLRVLPKIFLWPHYSGAPEARGPRFIEPPEPPVPTPLLKKDDKRDKSFKSVSADFVPSRFGNSHQFRIFMNTVVHFGFLS